jgi:hypothetical protein
MIRLTFGVDTGGANDDTFVTLGYSIGGVGIGYGSQYTYHTHLL